MEVLVDNTIDNYNTLCSLFSDKNSLDVFNSVYAHITIQATIDNELYGYLWPRNFGARTVVSIDQAVCIVTLVNLGIDFNSAVSKVLETKE
jgi:hypothetical protein